MLSVLVGAASQVSNAQAAPRHTSLRSITPADGAVLSAPPSEIVMEFDEAVSERFNQVVLTRAGTAVTLGATSVSGGTVRTPIPGALGAGVYRVAYRVVASDGHPITGQSGFEVTGAPSTGATGGLTSGAPTATATPTRAGGDPTTAAAPTSAVEANHVPGYAISGVLLLAAIGLLVWDRRRRRGGTDFPPEAGSV